MNSPYIKPEPPEKKPEKEEKKHPPFYPVIAGNQALSFSRYDTPAAGATGPCAVLDATEVRWMDRNDLPLGFSFALAQNPNAMKVFSNLPQSRQSEVLQKAHAVSSKEEMRSIVNELSAQANQAL